ncbi:NOG1 family protein [Saccharolobus solfataricus]|uniref:GTP-binding protein n=3 Tax=Saccharolobus solfataricus TaxID=2287 RepID=Q7LXR6_SACS2|nr:NOG1 family protein [Saccharolobus solfataricus]AAK40935.1 GTP-binding protein [Saccharolobus solfataricus P2]AKA73965.1 NOG1 family protein [Saccharolobus solfataricus]AKA76662.1 NOG1 family protein [Saccharolobus solfataricus]AKA79356.1 NOG1 family protein [Saccharolobus solfataricus]AZF68442.1 NOG1 family protein [Saccharolobus solfataricus]
MLNPFEKLQIPPKANQTIDTMLKRLPKIGGTTVRDREIRRLKEYYERIKKYYDFVEQFPKIDELHPFYLEATRIMTDINKLRICLSVTKKTSVISMKILKKYINQIRKSPENESNRIMRQAFGRVSSVLRKSSECIDRVIDVAKELKKIQGIDPTLPTIVVAGPPNVGKSTLVSKISTAKPEIASYPFTTKEVHVGHVILDDFRIQVIDTPGILDRPEAERNRIERKATNAIRNLNGIIVFMFDSSISSVLSVEGQIELFREVKLLKKIVIPVINKIDEKYEEYYKKIVDFLLSEGNEWHEISAEKGIGIDKLKEELFNLVKSSGTNEVSRD